MHSNDQRTHRVTPTRRGRQRSRDYEWRVVEIPRTMSRNDARALLTDHAEHGHWELARSQILMGGARRVWLKRRVIRMQRTDAA